MGIRLYEHCYQILATFGTNPLTELIAQSLAYVFLAVEKYLRVTDTMQDNEILANYNQFVESVSIDEAHERICSSLDNGFFDACDDFTSFIVTNLANFGDDLSYIV